VLRELISFFQRAEPLKEMESSFGEMLRKAHGLTMTAGELYFGGVAPPERRTEVYEGDVEINKLQRRIRRQVIAHLSVSGNAGSLPYCLLLISLVKDVERIGDYAKNLVEILDFRSAPPPDDDITAELRSVRDGVEEAFRESLRVFETSDRDQALSLIRSGRDLNHRCDTLVTKIAHSDYNANDTASVLLGVRYYKRIGSHVLNVLSSVVMPLHKLDYYDEKYLPVDVADEDEDE
jgi:phosphate uptake regulator